MKQNTLEHYKKIMENIREYIVQNTDAELSLTVLAKQFAISAFHLSRVFKSISGLSLNSYIRTQRLENAFQLIAYTSLKINDTAITTGFNDYETFSRSFKKYFKIAPADLRKIIKQIRLDKNMPAETPVILKSLKKTGNKLSFKIFSLPDVRLCIWLIRA